MIKLPKGFTLIELLMVMGVLAGLVSIGLMTYPGAQKSARDTRRKSDTKQYQTSLETFANRSNGLYPHYAGQTNLNTLCGSTVLNIPSGSCVDDPLASQDYNYFSSGGSGVAGSASATGYVIYASLERTQDGNNQYWVICSSGSSGRVNTSAWTPSATCPANLVP